MKRFGLLGLLVILFTFLVYFILTSINILPAQASLQAITIDRLFNLHFWIISFLFSLIVVFMVYSLVVFRSKPGEEEDGQHIRGNDKLEIFWTFIPLVVVVVISYLGALSLAETRREDPQALRVKVTAGQWFWRYEYPEYGITSSTLTLPVDQQVVLEMTSVDVIHSFWVPEFRVKQDVLPGENLVRELRFTPTIIGSYTARCAELCGGAHAYMNSPVEVLSNQDFKDWIQVEMGAVMQDPAARGERIAQVNGCIGCHSLDGSQTVGPTWLDLYLSERTLIDGSIVIADEEYLIKGIIEPNDQIPAGYPPNVMPQIYKDTLNDQEIQDLVEFMKSLSQES